MRRTIFCLLFTVCTAVMAYSGYRLYSQQRAYRAGEKTYGELRQFIRHRGGLSSDAAPGHYSAKVIVSDGGDTDIIPLPEVDFDALLLENPDTVGWIFCEGTRIDYPVVQASDNDYYLHRLFSRDRGICGTIFLDYECAPDFTDFNSVTYGHHMRDGSMYHDLVLYKNQSFYDEHPSMILLTPGHTYVVQLFAGFTADAGSDAWRVTFCGSGEETSAAAGAEENVREIRQKWLDRLISRSCFRGKLTPDAGDRILTLSTCSYEFDNARFVLYGILTQVR